VLQGDPTVHIAAPKRLRMCDVMVMALTGGQIHVCNLTLIDYHYYRVTGARKPVHVLLLPG